MKDLTALIRLEVERDPDPGELINLVPNPSGDLGAWGYLTPVAGSVLRSAQVSGAYRLTYTSPGAVASYFTTEEFPVTPGRYLAASWVASAVTGYYRVAIEWLSAPGVVASSTAPTGYLSASATAQSYGAFAAPSGATLARLRFQHVANTSGGIPAAGSSMSVSGVTVASAAASAALKSVRTNLMPTPSGESGGPGGWSAATGASMGTASTQSYVGSRSLTVSRGSAAGALAAASATIPVTGGRDYAFQVRARSGATRRTVKVSARWFAGQTAIAQSELESAMEPNGAWSSRLGGVATAPSGADGVQMVVQYVGKASAGEVHYLDAAMVEQASRMNGYFDGASSSSGVTYAWSGVAQQSASTATTASGVVGELVPVPYLNVLGPTHEIRVNREGLNLGTLDATVIDANLHPANDSTIRPGRRVRLTTTEGQTIFAGKILAPEVGYQLLRRDPNKRVEIRFTAVDAVNALASSPRSEGVATIDDLPFVLEGCGVPWSCNGSGDQVATAEVVSSNSSATALDQVVVTRDSDGGLAWVDRNGVIVVSQRDLLPAAPVASLDEADYGDDLEVGWSVGSVINSVTINVLTVVATSGAVESVPYGPFTNAESINTWGLRPAEYTVQGTAWNETTAATFAGTILAAQGTPQMGVNKATVDGSAGYALLDLFDVLEISNESAGLDQSSHVTSLEHLILPGSWLTTLGFGDPGDVVASSVSTTPPPPAAGAVADDVSEQLGGFDDQLEAIYETANNAAAAAADAAANATTALTAANGKNKVTFSLNAPGATANTAGDIWFRKDSATQTIIGQWEGLGGTSWSAKTLRNEVIANLDAGKLIAGSAFINALLVKTNFTLGDATTDGVIQSYNFANSSVGVFINKNGLVAKGGSIAGAAITGGIVSGAINRGGVFSTSADTTDANYLTNHANRLQMRTMDNAGILEGFTGNSVLTFPGRMTISTGTDGADSAGRGFMRLSSPTDGSYSPAYVEIASKPVAGTGSANYSDYIRMKSSDTVIDGRATVLGNIDVTGNVSSGLGNLSMGGSTIQFGALADGGAANSNTGPKYVRATSTGRLYASTTAPSSRDIKHDINTLEVDALSKVRAMRPVTYRYNEQPDTVRLGLIAEEVHDLGLHVMVGYEDHENPEKPTGIDYDALGPLLVSAVQQQQTQIDSLTARLDALEADRA